MTLLLIRQSADTAAQMLHALGDTVPPIVKDAIDAHFDIEAKANGMPGVEFMQGFFSGVFFANDWIAKSSASGPAIGIATNLTLEAARKYLERIEEQLQAG